MQKKLHKTIFQLMTLGIDRKKKKIDFLNDTFKIKKIVKYLIDCALNGIKYFNDELNWLINLHIQLYGEKNNFWNNSQQNR